MKKKKSQPSYKQQLQDAQNAVNGIFYELQAALGDAKVLELILASYEDDLMCLDDDIDNEEWSIESYGTSKEINSALKQLRKRHKELESLIKTFKAFIKQHHKLTPHRIANETRW